MPDHYNSHNSKHKPSFKKFSNNIKSTKPKTKKPNPKLKLPFPSLKQMLKKLDS